MRKPLEGIRVLDFSRYISGPNCAMILGDLGADVIKLEKLRGGDESRILPPAKNGESFYYCAINRNKRSVCLDFRNKEVQDILFDMAKQADVIIQNFRPGTMEKMGLGYERLKEVNPGLVMAQISGFGQDGPYKDKPGFDAIAQAMSGLMSISGDPEGPPMLTGTFFVDFSTSFYTAIGIIAALYDRNLTGVGQVVDTTLLDSSISMLLSAIPDQLLNGVTMGRVGNRDRYSAPANTFKTKDGDWVILIAGQDVHFKRFVEATGMEYLLEDPRFEAHIVRLEHAEEIEEIVKNWVETIADLVNNPQIKHRNKIVEVDHKTMGKLPMAASAINFSNSEFEVRYAPPLLGEHTDEVLKEWLDIGADKLEELHQKGIIK